MRLLRPILKAACRTFAVSEPCYRYSAKPNEENEQIADLLVGFTRAKKTPRFRQR
nr:hypothetical protein [Rhizobium gei]